MKLADAFLYVVFDNGWAGDALVAACERVIAGGGDILQIAAGGAQPVDEETARRIAQLCRDEEALLVLRDNAEMTVELDAAGVHMADAGLDMGIVRAVVGNDRAVGASSDTLDDARLSLEVGADYLLHHAGRECAADFAALRYEARVPLFAAGLSSIEDAQALVADEVFRLCLDVSRLDADDLTESTARYARLLGRCL